MGSTQAMNACSSPPSSSLDCSSDPYSAELRYNCAGGGVGAFSNSTVNCQLASTRPRYRKACAPALEKLCPVKAFRQECATTIQTGWVGSLAKEHGDLQNCVQTGHHTARPSRPPRKNCVHLSCVGGCFCLQKSFTQLVNYLSRRQRNASQHLEHKTTRTPQLKCRHKHRRAFNARLAPYNEHTCAATQCGRHMTTPSLIAKKNQLQNKTQLDKENPSRLRDQGYALH